MVLDQKAWDRVGVMEKWYSMGAVCGVGGKGSAGREGEGTTTAQNL